MDRRVRLRGVTVREFIQRLARHRLPFLIAVAFLILNTLCGVAVPRAVGWIVDSVLLAKQHSLVPVALMIYLSLEGCRILSGRSLTIRFSALGQTFMAQLRAELFEKVLSLPVLTVRSAQTGALTSRLTTDVAALGAMFEAAFLKVIERLFMIIGILISIVLLAPVLGLSALMFLPLFLLLGVWFTRKLFVAYHQMRRETEGLQGALAETVRGISVVRLFGLETERSRQYEERSLAYQRAARVNPMLFSILHPAMTIVIGFSIATFLAVGAQLVYAGALTPGTLVTLTSYAIAVFWPLLTVINQWNVFLQGMAAAERLFEVLEWQSEDVQNGNIADLLSLADIRFNAVSYVYPSGTRGLDQVSLKIPMGSLIGLVGPSGAGKSTLVQIALQFLNCSEGEVQIGTQRITEIPLSVLRRSIGYAPQSIFLFQGSIRENLSWSVREEQIQRVMTRTDFPPAVAQIIQQLDRPVASLSVGQRQILSLLRLILSDPPFWILDEPGASIDKPTELWLRREIRERKGSRTIIVVSHGLKIVSDLDRLFVLQHGRLAQEGTHEELLSHDGLYRTLVELQRFEDSTLQNSNL